MLSTSVLKSKFSKKLVVMTGIARLLFLPLAVCVTMVAAATPFAPAFAQCTVMIGDRCMDGPQHQRKRAATQSNLNQFPQKEGFGDLTRKLEIPKSVNCKNFAVQFFPMKRGYYTNKELITAPVFSAAIVRLNGNLDVATIASYGVPYDIETNTWVFSFHTSGWMITDEMGQCVCGDDRMNPSCPKAIEIKW